MASPAILTALVTAASLLLYKVLFTGLSIPKNIHIIEVDEKKATKNHKNNADLFPSIASALAEAFPKFRETAFHITGKHPVVWTPHYVVPPKFIESLKGLPDNQLSLIDVIHERHNSELTGAFISDPARLPTFIKTITVDLTRHISKVMDLLDDELTYAFNKALPSCHDWTEVYPAEILPEIVALASGRIFVGLPLCRDEEFLKSTVTFTIDAFLAGEELHDYPKMIRPYVAPFLKKVRTCRRQKATMHKLLKPELERRKMMIEQGNEDLPTDVMTWTIQNHPPHQRFDLAVHAETQLNVSLAAIHTTTITATNAIFDLAEHQEYLEPLRKEWAEVIATEDSGVISKASMPKLKKLDSFIKESQRLHPLGPISFLRKIKSDLTLPDGTILPKNSTLCVAASEIGRDGKIWENPDQFDGFRFEKLRQLPGKESHYQFATTSSESMYFGHGKHACPGRFFAQNEIKLILAYIFRNYDIKYPEGESRPAIIVRNTGNHSDPSKSVLLRRRKL